MHLSAHLLGFRFPFFRRLFFPFDFRSPSADSGKGAAVDAGEGVTDGGGPCASSADRQVRETPNAFVCDPSVIVAVFLVIRKAQVEVSELIELA